MIYLRPIYRHLRHGLAAFAATHTNSNKLTQL